MTHKSSESSDKSKVWINSRFRFTPRRRVWDPRTSQEELYKEYIMQAKTALHNSKNKKEILPAFILFDSTEKEGGFFHPPILWKNNPAAKLPDLTFTWPDFIKKIKCNKSFSVGFFEPSSVWKVFFVCW